MKNTKPKRFKTAFILAAVLSFVFPGFGRQYVCGAEEVQILEFSVVRPESPLTDEGYEVEYVEHPDSSLEYRCSFRGHHFFSVLLDNEGAYAVRPRPGVDPDGWGTTVYLHPHLSGVVLENADLAPLEVSEDGVVTSASGDLRDAALGQVGNWSVSLDVSYDPEAKKIVGNGDLEIVLTEALVEDQDIVVTKMASNFLQDVPLLPGGEGNTGDTTGAYYEGSELPRQFWNPATQPGHFPQDPCEWIDIELPGEYNIVDTARQADPNDPDRNIRPIKAAWKPSVRLRFDLKQADENSSFMFGAIFDTLKGDDFSADNIGVTPLLRDPEPGRFDFDLTFESNALPGDTIDLDAVFKVKHPFIEKRYMGIYYSDSLKSDFWQRIGSLVRKNKDSEIFLNEYLKIPDQERGFIMAKPEDE